MATGSDWLTGALGDNSAAFGDTPGLYGYLKKLWDLAGTDPVGSAINSTPQQADPGAPQPIPFMGMGPGNPIPAQPPQASTQLPPNLAPIPYTGGPMGGGSAPPVPNALPPQMQPGATAPPLPPPQAVAPSPSIADLPPQNAQLDSGPLPPEPQTQGPGMSPDAAPIMPAAAPTSPLMTGFQSWAHTPVGSPMEGLANLISGITTGQRTDPQGMAMQQMQATYSALVQSGVPEPTARAAALNPRVMEQLAPQLMGGSLVDGGTDPSSGQKMWLVRKADGTTAPLQIGGQGGGGGSPGGGPSYPAVMAAAQKGVTGEALMDYMQPQDKALTQQILDGRIPVNAQALRNPALVGPLKMASLVDPTLDMSENSSRAAAMQSARSGDMAERQKSMNQTVHHVVTQLMPAMQAMHNTQYPVVNDIKNGFNNYVLGKHAQTDIYPALVASVDEVASTFKSELTDSQVKAFKEGISPGMSPEQQAGSVKTLLGLMQGASEAVHEKRAQAIGPVNDEKMGPMLHAGAQKEMASAQNWIDTTLAAADGRPAPGAPQPPAAPAAPPVIRATAPGKPPLVLSPDGKQWVPAQ